jgi:hypothetical protein
MAVTEAEERATRREDRPTTRLLLAHRMKPARDRAVVRAFLRALGVAFTEAEIVAPVEAPIDVRFRQAHLHLRDLFDHQRGRDWQEKETWVHQARALADGGDPRSPAVEGEFAGVVPHVTGARGRSLDPARLALGVGVVSALRDGAVCGERRADLSAHDDRQAVTAMEQHRHPVRKGKELNPRSGGARRNGRAFASSHRQRRWLTRWRRTPTAGVAYRSATD